MTFVTIRQHKHPRRTLRRRSGISWFTREYRHHRFFSPDYALRPANETIVSSAVDACLGFRTFLGVR